MCTPNMENGKEIASQEKQPGYIIESSIEGAAFTEEPIAPKLKIELCFMSGMTSRSQPPVHPTMDIAIVNCKMGETCTPANSEIFGNEFGYVKLLLSIHYAIGSLISS